ncbi:MAG: MEDS domain-containing protein [Elusimicrobiota bacterium]
MKHTSLFYHNTEEQFFVSIPYLKQGLERNEKCYYVSAGTSFKRITDALRDIYPKTDSALKSKQLELMTVSDCYLSRGFFNPQKAYRDLKNLHSGAIKSGYSAVRALGEMDWILEHKKYTGALREYEFGLNELTEKIKNIKLLCQFNAGKYDEDFLKEMIMAHSCVIYGRFQTILY